MGRRRGSASSNFAQGGIAFDLFTTDSDGDLLVDSDASEQSGLFEGAVQNFSYLLNFNDSTRGFFEESNDLNNNIPLFEGNGDLTVAFDTANQTLRYEIVVLDDLEYRYPFEFSLGDVRSDLGLDDTQILDGLVNSLTNFSELITLVEQQQLDDAVGFLPFFEGQTLEDVENIYPNLSADQNLGSLLKDFPAGSNDNPDISGQDRNVAVTFDIEEDVDPIAEEAIITVNQFGTEADETFQGGANNDTFFGNGGQDSFFGEAGDDNLYGGNQADEINGGDDDDTLFGNEGANFLVGGDGNDTLYGGNQADNILGGAGDDTIYDNSGDDFIDSGSGFDLIRLGGGNDIVILSTGEGYDTIENYQLGMTTLKGFDQSELSFVESGGNTEIFKGTDQLAVVRWKTKTQVEGGLFAA